MTPITFSKNSWHARLVNRFTQRYASDATNICQYMRWVGWGLLGVILVTLALSVFATFVLSGIVWDIQWLFGYVHFVGGQNPPARELGACILNLVAVLGSIVAGLMWISGIVKEARYHKKWHTASPSPPPGFIRTAYRSFKDKVCIRVEVK